MEPKRYSDTGLTFGVEIECLWYYSNKEGKGKSPEGKEESSKVSSGVSSGSSSENQSDSSFDSVQFFKLNPEEAATLPDPLVLTDEDLHNNWHHNDFSWVFDQICQAILTIPGSRIRVDDFMTGERLPSLIADGPSLYPEVYAFETDGWLVKEDGSVSDEGTRCPADVQYGYPLPLEIVTPALWDNPKALNHVMDVYGALTKLKRFRLRTNLSTGFHVHVGNGTKPHHLSTLQRAAALVWAADGYMCHAHPPERSWIVWAPSIRESTTLANEPNKALRGNALPAEIPERPAHGDRCLPSHLPRAYPDKFFPSERPKTLPPDAKVRIAKARAICNKIELEDQVKAPGKTGLLEGVGWIMASKKITDIGNMMKIIIPPHNCGRRASYSFGDYLQVVYAKNRGTVEFREAAGTLNPEWIAVWASICMAFFRTAKYATDDHFWTIIYKLAENEKTPGKYDMISLLMDMGVPGPARYLETALREIGDLEFWYPCRPPY